MEKKLETNYYIIIGYILGLCAGNHGKLNGNYSSVLWSLLGYNTYRGLVGNKGIHCIGIVERI